MADSDSSFTSGAPRDNDMCSCGRRVVDLYCYTENQLLCKLCKSEHHSTCDTRYIYTLTDGIFESKDLQRTITELNSIKSAFLKFESSETLHAVRRTQARQTAIEDSKRLRIKREKTQLEREINARITDFQQEMTFERMYEKRDSSKMVNNIEYFLDLLDHYRKDGNAKKLFILLYKLKTITPFILDILNSLYDKQRHHLINSQIKGTLRHYLKSDNPGNVKLTRSLYNPEHASPRRLSRSINNSARASPRRSTLTSDLETLRGSQDTEDTNMDADESVRSNSLRLHSNSARVIDVTDTTTNRSRSSITRYVTTASFEEKSLSGVPAQSLQMNMNCVTEKRISVMKMTNDGRILMLDYCNQMLELYSLNKTFLFALKVFRPIWDFDFTGEYEILVTCPYEGVLQYVQFSDEDLLFETSYLSTNKGCRAICAFYNRLFVSYTGDEPCIRYMSKDGVTYRTINSILNGRVILVEPLHIHVSRDRNYLFISDYTLQRVTILNHHGDIVKSHDTFPGSPLAMTTDREGNVLVSVAGSNEIRMISRDGLQSRTLIESYDLGNQPSAVAYKTESKLLLVAFDKEAIVKMVHII